MTNSTKNLYENADEALKSLLPMSQPPAIEPSAIPLEPDTWPRGSDLAVRLLCTIDEKLGPVRPKPKKARQR